MLASRAGCADAGYCPAEKNPVRQTSPPDPPPGGVFPRKTRIFKGNLRRRRIGMTLAAVARFTPTQRTPRTDGSSRDYNLVGFLCARFRFKRRAAARPWEVRRRGFPQPFSDAPRTGTRPSRIGIMINMSECRRVGRGRRRSEALSRRAGRRRRCWAAYACRMSHIRTTWPRTCPP